MSFYDFTVIRQRAYIKDILRTLHTFMYFFWPMLKWTNKEINPSDNKKPVRITEQIRSDQSEKAYYTV